MPDIVWNEGALLDQIKAALQPALEEAGKIALEVYQDNIKRGPRSGVHYPGSPARSSSANPLEFPQEQSGVLRDQAESWVSDNGTEARIGYPDGSVAVYFRELEYKPVDDGGRRMLSRTANSDKLKQAIKTRSPLE